MATETRLTLEEFLALPDTEPASEYVCGEVWQKPMPDEPHSILQFYLAELLTRFLRRERLGRVRLEWRCIFGPPGEERAWVPDLVYVSFQTRPPSDPRRERHLRAAPDLAIEVMSPDQPAGRFADKLNFYLRHGVRFVWVVDPDEETIRVYRPGEDARTLRPGDSLDGGDVLPGFSVSVAEIFAQLQEA